MQIRFVMFLFLLLLASVAHASVKITQDAGVCNFRIEGVITTADASTVQSIIKAQVCKGRSIMFALNSPGGDVAAGIRLGEYIRDLHATAAVAVHDSCASTCVLVLLGGVRRFAWGAIGLHRPYSTRMDTSTAEAEATYSEINSLVSSYLSKMNIPSRLLDEMNAVSPGDVRWISKAEKVTLHIDGTDPLYEDVVASSNAKRLGISKEEFFRRSTLASDMCSALPNNGSLKICYDAVMRTGRAPQ